MNCPFRMETGAYALGVLTPPDHARMSRHLKTCRPCQSDVTDFTALLRSLRTLNPRPDAPPTVRETT